MTKKAIFGGTFDPIHNGHINIAKKALQLLKLDNVVFMPSGNPPHKIKSNITDGKIRYELIKAGIQNEKFFEVSSYEISKEGYSYTYQTMKYFKDLEPDTLWYFLLGADSLIDIDNWKRVDKIIESSIIVVLNRPGYRVNEVLKAKEKVENTYGKEVIYLKTGEVDVSATKIRSLISENKDVSEYIPKAVIEKIKEFNLYKQ
ncbi:MAG: nicotinate-nucleotide adenylyltransferase [Bacillota bacterium]|nr:nicotinate-nucleotide adenylyltransferase [Bacillota bacterium]